MNIKSIFPQTENQTYLNTAACGLISVPVLDYKINDLKTFYKKGSAYVDNEYEILDSTKQKISTIYNSDLNRIGVSPNFSLAYNAVLDGLPSGTNFLCLEEDYFSVTMPIKSRGFKHHCLPITSEIESDVYDYISTHKPDVLALSSVQYLSGIKIETGFFSKLKQDFPDLKIIVDATQYLGTEEFDFKTSGIDCLISSCYKWLNAGFGIAITLLSEEFYNDLTPKQVGSNSYQNKTNLELWPMGFLEPGHYDLNTIGALARALDLHYNEIGIKFIKKQISDLSTKAFERLAELGLLDEHTLNRQNHSGIFMLRVDQHRYEQFKRENIILSKRGSGLRISFHYYNTFDDLEHLIDILKA